MGLIGDWGAGATPLRGNIEYYGGKIPWLKTGELNNGLISSTEEYITDKALEECSLRLCNVGDILIAMYGATIGKLGIAGIKLTTNQACCACSPIFIYNKFLFYFLMASKQSFIEQGEGGAQPNISRIKLVNYLFPLPPLKEQQRIVEKIEELTPHIELYGKAQAELDLLNKNIKEQLKKSVLQYAIEGKLVPQDETEGTAEVLLEQIQKEKLKLYEENKLKKKDLEHSIIFKGEDNKYYEKIGKNVICIDEEIPFEIPNGWVWARGTTLFLPMESTKPKGENFTYIDLDAVNNKKNNIDNPKILKSINAPSRASRKLHTNDVLYSMVRPYLRNIALVDKKFSNAIASTGFYVITPSIALHPHFLFHLMLSSYVTDGLNLFMKGENSPSINNSHIEDFLYPLPPLAEQQRIVESIDAIFRCIEKN